MRRTRVPLAVVALASLLAGATGCGDGDPSAGPEPSALSTATSPSTAPSTGGPMPSTPDSSSGTPKSSSPSSGSTGPTLPLLPRPTAPPKTPTDIPQPVTVRGQVVEPTSDGCVELQAEAARFALALPEGTTVAVGDVVEVTGTPRPQVVTPCTGVVLGVTQVRPG